MSEDSCGVDIGQLRQTQNAGELDWLDKFESTCSEEAGHEGVHVFRSEDDEQLHWDEDTQQFGSYQDAPAAVRNTFSF